MASCLAAINLKEARCLPVCDVKRLQLQQRVVGCLSTLVAPDSGGPVGSVKVPRIYENSLHSASAEAALLERESADSNAQKHAANVSKHACGTESWGVQTWSVGDWLSVGCSFSVVSFSPQVLLFSRVAFPFSFVFA